MSHSSIEKNRIHRKEFRIKNAGFHPLVRWLLWDAGGVREAAGLRSRARKRIDLHVIMEVSAQSNGPRIRPLPSVVEHDRIEMLAQPPVLGQLLKDASQRQSQVEEVDRVASTGSNDGTRAARLQQRMLVAETCAPRYTFCFWEFRNASLLEEQNFDDLC